MTFKKTKLCLGLTLATLTMAGALVSPEAMAKKAKHQTAAYSNSTASLAQAANRKAEVLEAQLQAMQDEIVSLRAQVNAPRADGTAEKVQELDQWMASEKDKPVVAKTKDNMMFFRGGWGHNNQTRGGTLDPTYIAGTGLSDRNGTTVGPITDQDSYYFGAGFDFSINDNLFGLMDGTQVLAELQFEYKELGIKKPNGLSPRETGVINAAFPALAVPAANTAGATVAQVSLSASPKIKFLKGKPFRPWIIPIGFDLSIISPPSDAITVFNPGMVFGIGADYKVWKDIYVGTDFRYHQALNSADGVNTNGLTIGGYLGLGF